MTTEQFAKVPAVFTEVAHSKMSNRYKHVSTKQVIDDLEKLGWVPSRIEQVKSRAVGEKQFARHMVRFQNKDVSLNRNGDIMYPEILLINSHNGSSTFKFEVGVYRLICTNGLIIKTEDFGGFNMRHTGYSFSELSTCVADLIAAVPSLIQKVDRMQKRIMTYEEQASFALKAMEIRFKGRAEKIDIDTILMPQRQADVGDDLWKLYNVVQEKLMTGGYTTGKTHKARKITAIAKDMQINRELSELLEEYL